MIYKDAVRRGDYIHLTEAESQRLIAAITPRWQLAAKILYWYGMRISEVLSLTSNNFINGDDGPEMVCKRLKHGLTTHQKVAEPIREELEKLIQSTPRGHILFPIKRQNFWKHMQRAAYKAGVDPVKSHPHAWRHACGRKWMNTPGATLGMVGAMLGHRDMRSTMRYARLESTKALSEKFLP